MSQAAARKDIQKLQRAIVDGLEHVKAHDIRVYDTAHLSPLFERVLIASGASNRQTRAIAASVRDKVRAAGWPKPRLEGEENGEWIIIDCGAAVAHVMQPAIRQYYRLEEIWGDKPLRLKIGAPKPAAGRSVTATSLAQATAAKKVATKKPATKTPMRKTSAETAAKSASKKLPVKKTAASKAMATKKTARGNGGGGGIRTHGQTTVVKKTVAKKAVAKTSAKKTAVRKTAIRKSV